MLLVPQMMGIYCKKAWGSQEISGTCPVATRSFPTPCFLAWNEQWPLRALKWQLIIALHEGAAPGSALLFLSGLVVFMLLLARAPTSV